MDASADGRVDDVGRPGGPQAGRGSFERQASLFRFFYAILKGRKVAAYIVGMDSSRSLKSISDDELLRRLSDLLRSSRRVEADLVAHIGEVDERRLFARDAAPSMFAWCTDILHLSEAEAYLRIAVARASREHPMLIDMLREGRLHLTGIAKLAPYLTRGNRQRLLERAAWKSKRQIEVLIAEISPRPDAPALMRKLPESRVGGGQASGRPLGPNHAAPSRELCPDAVGDELVPERVEVPRTPTPARPARVEPLSPARYKVQFTASAELHDKLERLRALMRSSVPDGDLAAVIEAAVTEKLERLEAMRFAKANSPRNGLSESDIRPGSRHIPAAVKRLVYERDGGRCRFVDAQGRRCTARNQLEYHHRHPFGFGGDRSPDNLSLMCPTHNQYLADHDYGKKAMAGHRRSDLAGPPHRRQSASRTLAP
jgi:hypothetical protein